MVTLRQPTGDECGKNSIIVEDDRWRYFAAWYPQMGGYVGACLVELPKKPSDANECFDVYVWHDGEFPFDVEGVKQPSRLHHCMAGQFVLFGWTVQKLMGRSSTEHLERIAHEEWYKDKCKQLDIEVKDLKRQLVKAGDEIAGLKDEVIAARRSR